MDPRTDSTDSFLHDHSAAPLCVVDRGTLACLRHRTVIDRHSGSAALALWQEEHLPGFRVPLHRHDCEEIITVIEGAIRATVGGAVVDVNPAHSIVIPSGSLHGFEVTSDRAVKLLALFASSDPKILREDGAESDPPWRGGATAHLDRGDAPGDAC